MLFLCLVCYSVHCTATNMYIGVLWLIFYWDMTLVGSFQWLLQAWAWNNFGMICVNFPLHNIYYNVCFWQPVKLWSISSIPFTKRAVAYAEHMSRAGAAGFLWLPLRDRSIQFFSHPLTALLPLIQFSAHSAPFSAPILLTSLYVGFSQFQLKIN